MGKDLTGSAEKSFLGNAAVVRAGSKGREELNKKREKQPRELSQQMPVGGIGKQEDKK